MNRYWLTLERQLARPDTQCERAAHVKVDPAPPDPPGGASRSTDDPHVAEPSAKRRVLVVEDEPAIRDIVTDLLRFEGYEVRQAGHGIEALSLLHGWRPDAIVLDLMMPVMDGWAFAEAAHRALGPDGVPILVASASPNLTNAAISLRPFGVRAAVAKPFDVDVLLAALEQLIERTIADAWPA